jgi:ketosteroid isomerase-like protein
MEKETEKLLQTDREFAAASLTHGAAEAFRMYLHENATMFTAGRNPVRGRDTIFEVMKPGSESIVLQWAPRAGEVSASGDMGWTWGEYVVISDEGGNETRTYGKYVNVWKKVNGGAWKVIADIGNDSPAPESGLAE